MKSILQQNPIKQFMQVAQLSQHNFEANKNIKFKEIREEMQNKKIVVSGHKIVVNGNNMKVKTIPDQILAQVPRRPQRKNKSKQQLQQAENESYLSWRRQLAEIEQNNEQWFISPYEKNIEIWKQLWRVVQRADLLVQIVDARNPLFFFSQDLNQYAQEVNPSKQPFLVINKSDLLTEDVRKLWNQYFLNHQIDHIFFSAISNKQSNSKINYTNLKNQTNEANITDEAYITTQHKETITSNSSKVLSPLQLIQVLQNYSKKLNKQPIQVGMVGYPNVGKSSLINALIGKKKVGVASMPGKTKHFQTLKVSQIIGVCDCPGLVFPKISESESVMVLNGIIPIDSIKRYEQAMKLLASRIKAQQICKLYGLKWNEEQIYDWQSILQKYATLKGFYSGHGLPSIAIAARNLLKDYVNGHLIYMHLPPHIQHHPSPQEIQVQYQIQKKIQKQLDTKFFQKQEEQPQPLSQFINALEEEDLLNLVEGGKLPNYKITKEIRKNIKFALKRGQTIEKIKKNLMKQIRIK